MATVKQVHSTFPLDLSLIADEETNIYWNFLQTALSTGVTDMSEILCSIPYPDSESYGPFATLSALLSTLPGPWPIFQLQLVYSRAWTALPEQAKAGYASPQARQLLERVLLQCKQSYTSLLDLFHAASAAPAIIDPESGQSLQHDSLVASIRNFSLPLPNPCQTKPVVAISLPNGPLLAVTVLATATYYTAAPLAHGKGVGKEQVKADILQSRSSLVLAAESDVARLGLHDPWLKDAGIQVLFVALDENMTLVVRDVHRSTIPKQSLTIRPVPNQPDDVGILLFTSGTSGTKKLVPLNIHSIICGSAMVMKSWGLSSAMRCLNQMPLYHVGGLVRNLYAPIMSGGSVICCSAFDANLFWDCVEDHSPTWYYASPSMHQCILESAADRPASVAKSNIKLVCNAAGGLLPSLACQLRETFSNEAFQCIILPSYGMTECMPISTPPLDYKLDKPGTSGTTVGPEITILDSLDTVVKVGVVGRICVRGAPLFDGYLKANDVVDRSCFTENGWFDTGDLGYLDDQSFLYLTGRSKEVINRGGELISPFEVEDAVVAAANNPESPTFGRINKALAFSAAHDTLQEAVGICIVTTPGQPRTCLKSVQSSVKGILSQVKIPVLIVYLDQGLPVNNNKVLRIRLAERLGIPELSDRTTLSKRHYEAECPPPNTPLAIPISCTAIDPDHDDLRVACQAMLPAELDFHLASKEVNAELYLAPKPGATIDSHILETFAGLLLRQLPGKIHAYHMPSNVIVMDRSLPRSESGYIDDLALNDCLQEKSDGSALAQQSSTEAAITRIFAEILPVAASDVSTQSDFFELGGDSMKAGRLLSYLRKKFEIRLTIDTLFSHSRISQLADLVDGQIGATKKSVTKPSNVSTACDELPLGCEETYCSTRPLLLLLQLVPLCILYPTKRAFMWTVFMYALSYTQQLITNTTIPGRLINLIVSMFVANFITKTMSPGVAILTKWTIIGRYKEGVYPMWGSYHTRWWICQKTSQVAGLGTWNLFNWSRCLYHRCMGANIGKKVTLAKGVILGEHDLLTIEDRTVLDRCVVRPFAAERNTSMYLGSIRIGSDSTVGLGSIVAAGTSIPQNTCIGPNSSSWESDDADETNRDLSPSKIIGAHISFQLVLGFPVLLVCIAVGALPWLGCLTALVVHQPNTGVIDDLRNIVIWFATPERLALHYAALAANATLGPVFFFFAVFTVKRLFDACFGQLSSGSPMSTSQMTKFRMQLMRTLMPTPRLHKLTELFGTHYEATSIFMRLMGANIGKRIYWPGTGPSVQDYHLLEIGDDVVFGSRSHLVTSDGIGSEHVRIGTGAMVADRVVLLPGVELGEKTVMGSGALTRRNGCYLPNTTWVGSKGGNSVCLNSNAQSDSDQKIEESSRNSSTTTLVDQHTPESCSLSTSEKGQAILVANTRSNIKFPSQEQHPKPKASVRWADQEASMEPETKTSSPFGRAFYRGDATYRVWTQFEIFLYSSMIVFATAMYWNVGSISAVQVVARIFEKHGVLSVAFLAQTWYRPFSLYLIFLAIIVAIMAFQSLAVLLFLITAKWCLIGRRKPGCYSWDISSYCQRWQLYLKLESFRRHCYGGHGILGMLTGTHWIVLYFRALGANIGEDCALFAGGLPSLYFTEPDLLTLGNRVSVDDASLVGHINTRGKFDLNPLTVGDRSVLRTGSRLLSGARMEADTCLLEHTLVMAGDVVDAGRTYQGWPADEFEGLRMPTMRAKRVWSVDA